MLANLRRLSVAKLLWIGLAGAGGALARYLVSGWVQPSGSTFPWGTLAVNVLGSLLFGFVWSLAEDRLIISGEMRLIILAGFMGSFTTFSTYIFETGGLLQGAQWTTAVLNLVAQNGISLVCLFLGLAAGRLI
jgi:CrcB protein